MPYGIIVAMKRRLVALCMCSCALLEAATAGRKAWDSLALDDVTNIINKAEAMSIRGVFPDEQVWVARPDSGNASAAFTVGFKGGHNAEPNNHNDVGSYVVSLGGILLAGDPGETEHAGLASGSKRYTMPLISSYGHPVPVLNGCYQEAGREYAARIIAAALSNDMDRVTMDIGGAYPKKAKVKSAVRTFIYDRLKKTFSIVDHIRFKVPGKVSVPILAFGFMEPKEGAEKGSYRLKASDNDVVRECDVSVYVKGADWRLSDGKRIDNPNHRSPTRYAILIGGTVKEVEIGVAFAVDEEFMAAVMAADPPPPDAAEVEVEEKPGIVLFDEEAGVKASLVYSGLEERVLAREIKWYLGEMTEETFPMVDVEPPDGPAVILKVDAGKGRVFTRENRVYISGHGSGLSRAVTHFLEELGVRYLMPGDIGRVIPGKTKVVYSDSDWQETPHPLLKETPSPERRQLISMLKSSTPVKRGFYAWHCVDISRVPYPTADGWELYKAVKGVDSSDTAACEALLADFRRAAYGPVARIMKEYFDEKAKPSPDSAKLKEILGRAAVEVEHEPAISSRIQSIRNSIW